jgi:hypothetical protein
MRRSSFRWPRLRGQEVVKAVIIRSKDLFAHLARVNSQPKLYMVLSFSTSAHRSLFNISFFQTKSWRIQLTLILNTKGVSTVVYIVNTNTVIMSCVCHFTNLEVVWSETKQTGLIDSLLHNYYVPPIIFGAYCHIDVASF